MVSFIERLISRFWWPAIIITAAASIITKDMDLGGPLLHHIAMVAGGVVSAAIFFRFWPQRYLPLRLFDTGLFVGFIVSNGWWPWFFGFMLLLIFCKTVLPRLAQALAQRLKEAEAQQATRTIYIDEVWHIPQRSDDHYTARGKGNYIDVESWETQPPPTTERKELES